MAQEGLIKQLLEAGVHFGHQTRKWNPKMKRYIFGQRSGIYIIDLEQTQEALIKAAEFLKSKASQGARILFVGTKKQAQDIIRDEATRCGMFYVTARWLGGTLTNFSTIQKSINRFKDYQNMKESGRFDKLTKKEAGMIKKEMEKLSKNLIGILDMKTLPAALYVVDPKKDEIAVKEAKKLRIPIVSLIDTNADPEGIDYIIPGNDDAIKSIKFVTAFIADAVNEGRQAYSGGRIKEEPQAADAAAHPLKEKDIIVEEAVVEAVEETIEKKIKKPDTFEVRHKPA